MYSIKQCIDIIKNKMEFITIYQVIQQSPMSETMKRLLCYTQHTSICKHEGLRGLECMVSASTLLI